MQKIENCNLRITFLQKCKHSDIILSSFKNFAFQKMVALMMDPDQCINSNENYFRKKLFKKNFKEFTIHFEE